MRSGVLVAAVAAASTAGCFYTGAINDRPSGEIRRDRTGEILRGSTETFRAVLEDPNNDELTIGWRAEACNAAMVCASIVTGTEQTFDVPVPVDAAGEPTVVIRIHLEVVDSFGAVARPSQMLELPVANNLPRLTVQRRGRELNGNFPPDVPIVVSATATDPDGDAVALEWELFPARASDPGARTWRPLPRPVTGGEEFELIPDVDGEWIVRVTASDGTDVFVADRTIVVVPDQAPCLGAIDPAPAPPGGALLLDQRRRFSVLGVDDDLDIYPAPPIGDPYLGAAGFRWYVRAPGATGFTHVDTDVAALELDPAQYAPGERVELRVEVDDRTGRTVDCAPDAPTCSDLQNQCLQRQTWTVEAR